MRAWQAGLSNGTIANMNVLSEMKDIRNIFKRCKIVYDDDVNSIIMNIIVFLFFYFEYAIIAILLKY